MYKIMLVDDEVWVRKGLKEQIEWEKLHAEFAGEAADGEEAYELAMRVKPDIIVTDVKMPFVDGIGLIEAVRKELPGTQAIVISGYSEFELVQKALLQKAVNYILKPIGEADLNRSIALAIEEIERRKAEDRQTSRLRATVNQSLPALREKHLNMALAHAESGTYHLEPYVAELRSGVEQPLFRICVIQALHYAEVLKRKFKQDAVSFHFAIDNVIQASGDEASRFLSFKRAGRDDEHVMLTVQAGSAESAATCEELAALLARIARNLKEFLGLSTTIGVGRAYDRMDNLHVSYEEAVHAAKHASGGESLRFYEDIRDKDAKPDTMRQILDYIHEHYREPLALESIAGMFHFNPSYLSRSFKTEVGENFSDYVVRLRMEQAVRLMRNPNLRTYEIAEMVGYENTNYFSKSFRKLMRESPSEYRDKLLRGLNEPDPES